MKQVDVAVGIITNVKGEILLTQRFSPQNPDVHLKWQLPGGGVEKSEKISETCVREVREETGLSVVVRAVSKKPIPHYYKRVCYNLYGCRVEVISGTIDIDNDIETNDAAWFEFKSISELSTLEDTLELIQQWIK